VTKWSREEPWTLTMETWPLKMEPWRVCRPVVADSHHFYEEQDPDPDPRQSEKSDTEPPLNEKMDPETH
jgi:hypothetical protein